jgi:hypothetical protein
MQSLLPYRAIAYVAAETQDIWALACATLLVDGLFGFFAKKISNIVIYIVIDIGPSKDRFLQAPCNKSIPEKQGRPWPARV